MKNENPSACLLAAASSSTYCLSMCSEYWCQGMNSYEGDLSDIFRGRFCGASPAIACNSEQQKHSLSWELPSDPMQLPKYSFGYPFSTAGDPLMAASSFLNAPNSTPLNAGILDNHMDMCPLQELLQIFPAKTMILSKVNSTSKEYLVDSSPLPIPRNPGIKRRKGQDKKVMCVAALTAANSRPSSGEVVPSDMWAWRKYGQKPIKGSPYPRGYYRCSTSKDCLARKQVERSRTDPNMLVITYCSEHNHPWPTQRNALAGSTRSSSSKNPPTTKEQDKESKILDENTSNSSPLATVKEELDQVNQMEMDDDDNFSNYKPEEPNTNQSDDFFAELGEIEAEPLSLIQKEREVLDPFRLYDWSGDHMDFPTKIDS